MQSLEVSLGNCITASVMVIKRGLLILTIKVSEAMSINRRLLRGSNKVLKKKARFCIVAFTGLGSLTQGRCSYDERTITMSRISNFQSPTAVNRIEDLTNLLSLFLK